MNENTLAAMNQIVNTMNEEGPAFLTEMSRDEKRAFQQLFSVCEDFMSLSEELQEAVEREERDGQPSEHDEWMSFDADC
jgi:hypothetical protein